MLAAKCSVTFSHAHAICQFLATRGDVIPPGGFNEKADQSQNASRDSLDRERFRYQAVRWSMRWRPRSTIL